MRAVVDAQTVYDEWVACGADGIALADDDVEAVARILALTLAIHTAGGSWTLRYEIGRAVTFTCVTERREYELLPLPAAAAPTILLALDRMTRPPLWPFRVLDRLAHWGRDRTTREFAVRWKGAEVPWVASWPADPRAGAIVLFRCDLAGVAEVSAATSAG